MKLGQCLAITIIHLTCIQANKMNDAENLQRSTQEGQVPPVDDIQFQMADLVTMHQHGNDVIQLEAFRVRNKYQWVSIGHPYFRYDDKKDSIYEFTPETITAQIILLSADQNQVLQEEAKRRNKNITAPVINLIPLSNLSCSTTFIWNEQTYHIKGDVHDFNKRNQTLRIPYARNANQRIAFEARVKDKNDLEWDCHLMAAAKEIRINSIQITAEQIQSAALEGKLFGPSDETYVTRNQLNKLAQMIDSKITIEEEYEMEEERFDNKILNQLLDLIIQPFMQISFDRALEKLSKFGTKYNQQDLAPSEIKNQFSKTLSVRSENGHHYVSAQTSSDQSKNESEQLSVNVDSRVRANKLWGMLKIEAKLAVNFAMSNEKMWKDSNLSIDEQLRELNTHAHDGVQWAFNGSRILPSSLSVAKLSRSTFNQGFTVARDKKFVKNAQYQKTILLQPQSSFPAESFKRNENIWRYIARMTRSSRGPDIRYLKMYFHRHSKVNQFEFQVFAETDSYSAIIQFENENGTQLSLWASKLDTTRRLQAAEFKHTFEPGTYKFLVENKIGRHVVVVFLGNPLLTTTMQLSWSPGVTIIIDQNKYTVAIELMNVGMRWTEACQAPGIRMQDTYITGGFMYFNATVNLDQRNHFTCMHGGMNHSWWVDTTDYMIK